MKSFIKRIYHVYADAGYPFLPLTKYVRKPLRWYYHQSPVLRHDNQFYWKPFLLKTIHNVLVRNIPQDFTIFHNQIKFRSYGTDMALHGYYVGEIEYHLIQFFVNCIKPNFVMFDVGAHHGLFTTIAGHTLQKNGWDGMLYSFEPFTENFEILQHNILQNGVASYVKMHPFAVADKCSEQNFVVNLDENSDNSLESKNDLLRSNRNTVTRKVQVTMLDSFLADVDHVDLIKIDVQGGEPSVLKGAQRMITKHQPIILVEAVQGLATTQYTRDFLVENEYNIFGVTKEGQLCEPNSEKAFVSWDWIGVPKSRNI